MRASTGTLAYDPSYDNYYPGPKGSADFYTTPQTSPEFELAEPRRRSGPDHRDNSASPPRHRHRRATLSAGGDGRAPPPPPITVTGDRPGRHPSGSRPIIHGGPGDRGPSPGTTTPYDSADGGDYYITPNTPGRRRAGNPRYYPRDSLDPTRVVRGDEIVETHRDGVMDRPHYRTSPMGGAVRRGYHLSGPLVRNPDADAYENRDAREVMYRKARRQRVNTIDVPPQRDRPMSMANLEEYLPRVDESGPPPSSRGFGGLDRSRSVGRGDKPLGDYAIDPNPFDGPPPRGRRPVSLHQGTKHNTYATSQSPMPGAFPSSHDDEYDEFDARRFSAHDDPPIEFSFRSADDRHAKREQWRGPGRVDRQGPEERGASGRRDTNDLQTDTREKERANRAAIERLDLDKQWNEITKQARPDGKDGNARSRSRRGDRAELEERRYDLDPRDGRPGRTPGPQGPAAPQTSKPAPAAPRKGILREPREHFPEHPEPIREGVLPLREKDPERLGIPPEARWTRISRRLVNPAALEGRERFEERDDSVIVLRVLTLDEIEMYTAITRRIRDERFERERERERGRGKDRHRDSRLPERRGTISNPPRPQVDTPQQPQKPKQPSPFPVQPMVQQPQQQQQAATPSPRPVIVDPPRRSDTLPASTSSANGGLRPNPDVPGTYLGYRRNPPPPVISKPTVSRPVPQ
ncbi:hypothetical protein GP486_006330 [Trichoglossum hirsutum]|uniref:DUF8035 domain-containing protein n=1 Tax=Trichoglossum hirsutum TaxID=265104 RepID=A0A9P8IEN7_9PEZI|nr:hypothetical protein GP486_006330 [Trichoglossum hirsutum]